MKKRNKKAFTLIELLAVIVILAIIALIAVPIVMNLISKARLTAAEDSAYGIIKSAENYYAEELLYNIDYSGSTFECKSVVENGNKTYKCLDTISNKELKFNGTKPTGGKLQITNSGKIEILEDLIINNYKCNYKNKSDNEITCLGSSENNGTTDEEKPNIVIPSISFTNSPEENQNNYYKNQIINIVYNNEGLENPTYYVKSTIDVESSESIISECGDSNEPTVGKCNSLENVTMLSANKWYQVNGNIELIHSKSTSENQFVYASTYEGTKYYESVTAILSIIDQNPPVVEVITNEIVSDETSITIPIKVTENESGIKATTCNYSTDENSYSQVGTIKNGSTCLLSNLNAGTTYYYQVCARDNLDNISECATGNFETKQPAKFSLKDKILSDNVINNGTPSFSVIEENEVGIYQTTDYDENGNFSGTSYYIRGANSKNYVSFADKLWRIVRINGDGTIRLISQDILLSSKKIEKMSYDSWPDAYVNGMYYNVTPLKTNLENWYSENLSTYDSFIATTKYCQDFAQKTNGYYGSWPMYDLVAKDRLYDSKNPSLTCSSAAIYDLKIGIMTADEVAFAGGVVEKVNNGYYLNNGSGQDWWTMTYFGMDSENCVDYDMCIPLSFGVSSGEEFNIGLASSGSSGIRPVINLYADVMVTGKGTADEPYKVQ